jgi:hypothetical protein
LSKTVVAIVADSWSESELQMTAEAPKTLTELSEPAGTVA